MHPNSHRQDSFHLQKPLTVFLSGFIYQKGFAVLLPALTGISSTKAEARVWNLFHSNNPSKFLGQGERDRRCPSVKNPDLAVSAREVTERGIRQEQCLGFISKVIKPGAVCLPGRY